MKQSLCKSYTLKDMVFYHSYMFLLICAILRTLNTKFKTF